MADRIVDGGFEEWAAANNATYWVESVSGTSSVERDTGGRSGLYGLKLSADASDNSASVAQAVSLVGARRYIFSIWYKNGTAGKTSAVVIRDSGSNKYLLSSGSWSSDVSTLTLPNSLTWRKFSIEFTALSTYSEYTIIIGTSGSASSSIYFDDASLVSRGSIGFMWDDEWATGTLTASSSANFFPATNTRHRWYKKPWRSANLAAPDFLKLDAGAAVSAEMLFLRYDNFNSTATVAIQANTSDNWANAAVNQALALNSETMAHIWATGQSYRYWRLSMNDANNPSNYVEVGRVMLGSVYEPTRPAVIGSGMREKTDPSLIVASDGGQISAIQRTKFRTGQLTFNLLPLADKLQFEALYENCGLTKPFVFVQDMGDPWQEAYYVEMTSFEVTPRYDQQFDVRMGLREAR